jgi:LysM repeat protein
MQRAQLYFAVPFVFIDREGNMMRLSVWGFIVASILMSVIGRVGAQDAVPTVAVEPTVQISNIPSLVSEYPEQIYTIPENRGPSLQGISMELNICPEIIVKSNLDVMPERFRVAQASMEKIRTELIFEDLTYPDHHSMTLKIPAHKPCYKKIDMPAAADLPQIEKDYNVCVEELLGWSVGYAESVSYYMRLDVPPCINEQGQRLKYRPISFGDAPVQVTRWYADGYSILSWIDSPEDFRSLGYCVNEIKAANPHIDLPQDYLNYQGNYRYNHYLIPQSLGIRIFIPQDVRHCDFVSGDDQSLYEVSQKYNVCMEVILESSNLTMYSESTSSVLSIPEDASPCYDEQGQRLNTSPESLYKPEIGKSFLEIAQEHHICMDALWDANPVMNYWDGMSYRFPEVMFIPDNPACEFTRSITSRSNMTLLGLAAMTNVCRNRIYDDNPHLDLVGTDSYSDGPYLYNERLPEGKTVNFRDDRPPCYRLTSQEKIEQIFYVCYAVPVNPKDDFTGHTPPVSFSDTLDLPYCYETSPDMTVIYENKPYTVYDPYPGETLYMIAECFGLDGDQLAEANKTVSKNGWPGPFWGAVFLPQPHAQDCWMLTDNNDVYWKGYRDQKYGVGWENAVFHTVQWGDTLNSIARQYGYLPSMIAAENDLEEPYLLQTSTRLRMPSFPSFYDIGKAGLYVGGVGIGMISFGVYRMRRRYRNSKGKKKNEAA